MNRSIKAPRRALLATFAAMTAAPQFSFAQQEPPSTQAQIQLKRQIQEQHEQIQKRFQARFQSSFQSSFQSDRQMRPLSENALNASAAMPKSYVSKTFTNVAGTCAKNGSCDLKHFKLEAYKSSTIQDELDPAVKDLIYGDFMVASYETKDLSSLEDFVIVQFIHGCTFMETKVNGVTQTLVGSHRGFYDFDMPFIHPNWTVDTIDADPMYASIPYDPSLYSSIPQANWKRHAGYRIHKPNPFVSETSADQTVYQNQKPSSPILYISDYPTPSYAPADRSTISTMSLNFRTCVFKASDVPTHADPSWMGTGKEIACFDWQNANKYDAKKDRFVDSNTIDPRCTDQKWAEELFLENATPPSMAPINWLRTSADYRIASNSCDALLGKTNASGQYFAGDLCKADLDHSRDYQHFSAFVNDDKREVPSVFMVRRLVGQGQASIDFSTLRSENVSPMGDVFHELRMHALDIVTKKAATHSDVDQAFLTRMQALSVKVLNQGAGCDGGAELSSSYDPVTNQIQVCPAWTHLPTESWVEMFSNRIADVLDVCSFKPTYTITAAYFTDLKKQNPLMTGRCFKSDPDLGNATIIGLVNSTLEPLVDAGVHDFESIQADLDSALLKCGLITAKAMPTQFDNFLSQEMWTCGRSVSGDAAPTSSIAQPWRDRKACGGRVRDVVEGAYGADLMAYYLRLHPNVVKADSKSELLFSGRIQSCSQQSLKDPRGLDSQERLGLYLGKPEILNGLGCQVTSTPKLCETTLFTAP